MLDAARGGRGEHHDMPVKDIDIEISELARRYRAKISRQRLVADHVLARHRGAA
jgi:hypothetical protein